MKRSTKRIIAIVISLVFILGCECSFAGTDDVTVQSEYEAKISENQGCKVNGGVDDKGKQNVAWLEFTAEKTGVAELGMYILDGNDEFGDDQAKGTVYLANSKEKRLSDTINYPDRNATFGVKKGTTYYFVTTSSETYFAAKYTIKSAKDISASSKSKAKTLKVGSPAKEALFVASTGTSTDWYKFKVSKTKETVFTVDLQTLAGSGKLTVVGYCGSKKLGSTTIDLTKGSEGYEITIKNSKTEGQADKGTYYLKITKNSKASGAYKISYDK